MANQAKILLTRAFQPIEELYGLEVGVETSVELLSWDFENFREFVSYETMQSAAAVLLQFEGEVLEPSNPQIQRMQDVLEARTGKTT